MEPLLHFVVPFVALNLLGVKPKVAFWLGLFGVVPDLDALILIHRSLSHSVVILVLVWAPILLYVRLYKPQFWRYALLGLLVLISHPMMDMVQSQTPVFWPIYGQSIYLRVAFNVEWGNGFGLSPKVDLSTVPTVFKPVNSFDYPIFTGEGLMVSLILLLPILLKLLRNNVFFEGLRLDDA